MSERRQKTGLLLPSREALLWADGDLTVVLDAARQAEKAGYDSVWAGDSLLARRRGWPRRRAARHTCGADCGGCPERPPGQRDAERSRTLQATMEQRRARH